MLTTPPPLAQHGDHGYDPYVMCGLGLRRWYWAYRSYPVAELSKGVAHVFPEKWSEAP